MSECEFKATFLLEGVDKDLIIKSFKTLEKEMRFSRGFVTIEVTNDGVSIVACAKDITSLRSLVNGVVKSLYLILEAVRIDADS
ncbi:MAG: KEOPS complex subunit Pcc1 [Vulcanisaeta sp.]